MKLAALRLALAAALLPGALNAAAAEGDRLSASVGLDYTTGDYGQSEDTDMLALAFSAKYETGRWTYRASLPYIHVTGPANVVVSDSGGVLVGPGTARTRTDHGLGDLVLGAAYLAIYGADAPFLLEVGGKVKLPTADEDKGLGTGETDWSIQADAFKQYGLYTPFATLGYRFYGDPPGINLRNVLYGSIGTTYRLADGNTVGAAYDFRDATVRGGDELSELSLFLTRKLTPSWQMQLYGVLGFSDASPDAGAGVVFTAIF